ncbi:hypothetical protein SLS56_010777 [Neofusicoccum ribis]|uniref:Cerato-platanin n=1 Tax=Neofusicoccum ribis TaxID=45134 RepID=A0ABR3SDI1_9PEZI
MQFKTLLFLASTAAAGYVELSSSDGQRTSTGDANSNTCFGPVNGASPFNLRAVDFTPNSISIFTDSGCFNNNVATCSGCTSVTYNGGGPVYGIFQ